MLVLFENFALDSERRELRVGGTIVPVEPQVFDVLVYLIANRDRVVSKDDLIASVWGGRIVSESTLTSRINAVRRAVGDSGDKQEFVRTFARKGVRWIAPVEIREKEAKTAKARTIFRLRCRKSRPSPSFPSGTSVAMPNTILLSTA